MIAGLPDKTVKKRILENLLQRIEAIKLVSNKLEELVLFDLYTNLITIVETPFADSLDIVMNYIETNLDIPFDKIFKDKEDKEYFLYTQVSLNISHLCRTRNKHSLHVCVAHKFRLC